MPEARNQLLLGQTLHERAKLERGEARAEARRALLEEAVLLFDRALAIDPENVAAHFNLDLIYRQLDRPEDAARHRERYLTFKPDDNAQDSAINIARRNDPAANHAAEAIVIYDLRRAGAYGLARADANLVAAAGGG